MWLVSMMDELLEIMEQNHSHPIGIA